MHGRHVYAAEKTRSNTLIGISCIPLAACGRKQQIAAGALYMRFGAWMVRWGSDAQLSTYVQ
eukprot:COSAG01_NODE_65728_length_272_cov_0.890173_1_plen_61_part_10